MTKDLNSEFAKYHQPVQRPESAPVQASSPQPVKARRLAYETVGVCMYCSKIMKKTMCCGQQMYICHDDRFVAPLPNEDLEMMPLLGGTSLGGLV